MSIIPGCTEVEALAPELAVGAVSGAERADALAHLGSCATCQRLVEELAAVADPILLLAPEVEPSIGFESRVLAATAAASAGDRPVSLVPARAARARQRRPAAGWLRLAVAALVLVVVAAGGLLVGQSIEGDANPIRTALVVTANGKSTCHALAYGNKQAWVFVSIDAPKEWIADYTVEVTTTGGGRAATVGHFHLQDGTGSYGAMVDVPAAHLLAVRVLDPSGALRYEAPFHTA